MIALGDFEVTETVPFEYVQLATRPTWMDHAACDGVSPSIFVDGIPAIAKRYCQACPVVIECYSYALIDPSLLGVWGGTTAKERHVRRIRKQLQPSPSPREELRSIGRVWERRPFAERVAERRLNEKRLTPARHEQTTVERRVPSQGTTELYRYFDVDDRLLYVGISVDARQRSVRHRRSSSWWSSAVRMDVKTLPTRSEALVAERDAIRTERPLFNITHNRETAA